MWHGFCQWLKVITWNKLETLLKGFRGLSWLYLPLGPAWSYSKSVSRGSKRFLLRSVPAWLLLKASNEMLWNVSGLFQRLPFGDNPTPHPPKPPPHSLHCCDCSHFKTFTALNRKFDLYAGPTLQRKHRQMQKVMFSRFLAGEKTITPRVRWLMWIFKTGFSKGSLQNSPKKRRLFLLLLTKAKALFSLTHWHIYNPSGSFSFFFFF